MIPIEQIIAALDAAGVEELEDAIRAQFALLRSDLPASLATILKSAAFGYTTATAATESGYEAFVQAHSGAAFLGRNLAGNTAPYGDFDVEFGKLIAEQQSPFLEKFLADIESGVYTNDDGSVNFEAIETRCDFYQERLRGTANEAFFSSLPNDELIDWLLGGDEGSACTVCPSLADNGPYKPADMPTWPGCNETPCKLGCRCTAQTQSGKQGF